jgi:hypothetical protein
MEPRARRDDLEIQRMGEEMVVYDLRSHEAHSLDAMAVHVWELADGSRDVAALAHLLQARIGRDVSADDVAATLQHLGDAGLLAEGPSRRELLRRAAMVGAVTLVGGGVLKTIIAPEPVAAQSGGCPGIPPELWDILGCN